MLISTSRESPDVRVAPEGATCRPRAPLDARGASAPVTSPVETPEVRARDLSETLPPYRLMLHNDDVNDMWHVVRSLLASVPELTPERAVDVMLEAHHAGQAQVIVCPLERAELYRDRLESFGLTATIERI